MLLSTATGIQDPAAEGVMLCSFYQHVVGTSEWDWACCWGHASTKDLVHWKHEPIALEPSAKGWDTAGVWSGCSTVDEHGQPVILYTAVRYNSASAQEQGSGLAASCGTSAAAYP